jgi:hypothetical protein
MPSMKEKNSKIHKINEKKRNFFFYRLYIIKHSFSIKMNRIDEEEDDEEEDDDGDVLIKTGEDNREKKRICTCLILTDIVSLSYYKS